MSELQVTPVQGERATYLVTSRTLYCHGECKFTYKPLTGMSNKYAAGDPCPKCGQPLQFIGYKAEPKLYGGLGRCGCPKWQYALQPLVTRLAPQARIAAAKLNDALRCDHLVASMRHYAVDRLNEEPSDGEGCE